MLLYVAPSQISQNAILPLAPPRGGKNLDQILYIMSTSQSQTCLSAIRHKSGSIEWVSQSFFTENIYLLLLEIMLSSAAFLISIDKKCSTHLGGDCAGMSDNSSVGFVSIAATSFTHLTLCQALNTFPVFLLCHRYCTNRTRAAA